MPLPAATVEATLRMIGKAAVGSQVAFDYVLQAAIADPDRLVGAREDQDEVASVLACDPWSMRQGSVVVSVGLVLGGGGPVGTAWYAGLTVGLLETDVDLRRVELVLGTSAGAVAGAWLTGDHTVDAFTAAARDWLQRPVPWDELDLEAIVSIYTRMAEHERLTPADVRELAALAAGAEVRSFAEMRARIAPALPATEGWPARLRCAVVDVDSGELVILGPADDVGLVDAVTASCSAAGTSAPAVLGGVRFMDGGMRSGTNADVLSDAELDAVVVVAATDERAPLVGPLMRRSLDREVDLLREAGKQVVVVTPDDLDHQAIGGNLLDVTRIPAVLAAGQRRGRELAPSLSALFRSPG